MNVDVTMQLQNFAKSADLRSENLRKQAADVRAEPGAPGFPEYDRARDLRASNLDAEAAQWTARAVKAREGYLLVSADDQAFQMDAKWSELINTCAAAGRTIYVEPQADPAAALS